MGREYSIRLNNKNYGDFYFHYEKLAFGSSFGSNNVSFVFSKKTKGIRKWKIKKNIIAEIDRMHDTLFKGRGNILIDCTELFENGTIDKITSHIYSRKRRYLVISKFKTEQIKLPNLESLSESIKKDCKSIINILERAILNINSNMAREVKDMETISINLPITSFNNKICDYKRYNENNISDDTLDIIDVSFNFRFIKLKTIIDNEES